MFGYIKIHKSELKVKEYELYKGLYCSLCKQLGREYGFLGRMTLNYDFTFFLMCSMALKEREVCFNESHCSFNPRKKCFCCERDNADISYTAAISILFSYYKLKDDISDNSFFKKLPALILYPLFRLKYKKALSKYPDILEELSSGIMRQNAIESKPSVTLDECADPSADVLGKALSYDLSESVKEAAYSFGYCIGRLVYILDAADDFEKDLIHGRFNPFKNEKYGEDPTDSMKAVLNVTADEAARVFDTLPIKRFRSIIYNVIFYGFEDTINGIFGKKE